MALIPADVGLRMRLENELLPQQITPVQEVAAELPRLQAGQVFTAQIRDVLPQSTYVALVAGKAVTLSLPESVKSGDVLELVVVDQTPKTIVAALANQPSPASGEAATGTTPTTLSQTAQMLRSLLVNEGDTPEAAPLNRGEPLLAKPPQSGAELVPVLNKAVSESGLFYEAHQAQWVAGKLPLASLLQEPQGQHPAPAQPALPMAQLTAAAATPGAAMMDTATPPGEAPPTLTAAVVPLPGAPATAGAAQTTLSAPLAVPQQGILADEPGTAPPRQTQPSSPAPQAAPPLNNAVARSILLYQTNQAQTPDVNAPHTATAQTLHQFATNSAGLEATATPPQAATTLTPAATVAGLETSDATRQTATTSSQMQPLPTMPDDLRTLVQQQLDAAGTQRLLWHGEVWPGQAMQWQLEWQEHSGGNSGEETAEPWQTKLRLITPRLGELEASLQLGAAGVRVALSTPDAASAADMRAAAADLENALAAAGVPLLGFTVKKIEDEQE